MRRVTASVLGTVAGLGVLLVVKSGPSATPHVVSGPARTGTTGGSTGSTPGPTSSGSAGGSGLRDGTFTGDSADTQYGPVQVKITVSGGRITDAQAVQVPENSGRDREINGFAVPVLQQETVGQASAQIDFVSGATFTSDGYQRSLQSALDKAKG